MAVKYRTEYKDIDEVLTRIDILDDNYSGSIIELTPGNDPLEINLPDARDIFTPVQGSGGTINVVVKDSDNVRSLYTPDPKKYQVKIYKGGTSDADVIFFGYVNTGFYSENFNEYDNYGVSIGFNDGLSILKRYDYLDSGTPFTDIDYIHDVIIRIIQKIGLPYHKLSICNDLTYSGYILGATHTVFEYMSVINSNYYDEQGEPMSFREVLEGILKALGLVCFTQGGKVIIMDPLKLEGDSIDFKNFDISTGSYIDTETIQLPQEIGTDCHWFRTGSQLDFQDGFSKIKLDFSGYASENILGITNWSDTINHPSEGTWVPQSVDPSLGEPYIYNDTWGGIPGYSLFNNAEWYAHDSAYEDKAYYVKWHRPDFEGAGDGLMRLKYIGSSDFIHGVSEQNLRIRMGVRIDTASALVNPSGDKDKFFGLAQKMRVKIGNQYWNGDQWTMTNSTAQLMDLHPETINDKWFTWEVKIPLSSNLGGRLELAVYDYIFKLDAMGNSMSHVDGRVTRIRDIVVDVVNDRGEVADYDLQFECDLNTLWENDAPKLELIHGDGTQGIATYRGGFIDYAGAFATNFQYGNMTSFHTLPEILFKKYSSQYQDSRMILTAAIKASDIYSLGISKIAHLKESTHLPGKKFILLSGKYNDRDKYIQGRFIQILPDDITIQQ